MSVSAVALAAAVRLGCFPSQQERVLLNLIHLSSRGPNPGSMRGVRFVHKNVALLAEPRKSRHASRAVARQLVGGDPK